MSVLGAPATAGALFFTSAVAAVLAAWGVASARALARRRATLDVIMQGLHDEKVLADRSRFTVLSYAPHGLAQWAEEDKEGEPDLQVIISVLNEFEIISIGIQRGILDYVLYERWYKTTVLRFHNAATPFIVRLRQRLAPKIGKESAGMIFHEFDELASWMSGEKKPKRGRLISKWF